MFGASNFSLLNPHKNILIKQNEKFQHYCVRGRAGRPAQPQTQHDYHHDRKVKPEAATAVIELLMMGGKTPEIC